MPVDNVDNPAVKPQHKTLKSGPNPLMEHRIMDPSTETHIPLHTGGGKNTYGLCCR
jgi:hypothetical protein